MCGGSPSTPSRPVVEPPMVRPQPKQAKGRRRTQDSATFARGAAARMNNPQTTLMSMNAPDMGKTLLGS